MAIFSFISRANIGPSNIKPTLGPIKLFEYKKKKSLRLKTLIICS